MSHWKNLSIGLSALVTSCTSPTIEEYAERKFKVDFKEYFNGKVEGWGAIFDFKGRQTRSFTVILQGTWQNNNGTLKEWFEFDDGEKMERLWNVTLSEGKDFTATASDVVGIALGKQSGNAINIRYTLQVPYGNKSTIDLSMDDWMYKIDDNSIINKTSMKKLGFKVGELVIFMKKAP